MRLQTFLNESAKSEAHEESIKKAFEGKILPLNIPKWMLDLGIKPGSKVINSRKTGPEGIKPDIIVTFDNNASLRISAKMSNADFFGNWYSKKRVIDDLGDEFVQPIIDVAYNFLKQVDHGKYTPSKSSPILGTAISFGKRSGKTGFPFSKLFNISYIKNIITGVDINNNSNANCLYTTSGVPSDIDKVLDNLKPVTDSVIKKLSENFSVIFRIIYSTSGTTQLSKPLWVKLYAKNKFHIETEFKKHSEILGITEFVKTEKYEHINGKGVINSLRMNNIILPLK